MTRSYRFHFVCIFILMALSGSQAGEADYISEVISRIDSYVSWADDKQFEGDGTKLVITAVGKSDLIEAIKKLAKSSSAAGKTIKVRVVEPNMIPSNSHILFLDITDTALITKITNKLRGSGTLVICHGKGLSSAGPSLNFVSETGSSKPAMELNLGNARSEGLSIKPALLKIAKIVE